MSPIRKILIAYDGSPPSETAFRYGLDLAESLHVAIEVLEVLLVPGAPGLPADSDTPAYERQARERLESRSRALVAAAESRGVAVSCKLVTGLAVEEIAGRARDGAFDLIIIGHHHRSALDRLFSRSVAQATIDRAPCATLVVG